MADTPKSTDVRSGDVSEQLQRTIADLQALGESVGALPAGSTPRVASRRELITTSVVMLVGAVLLSWFVRVRLALRLRSDRAARVDRGPLAAVAATERQVHSRHAVGPHRPGGASRNPTGRRLSGLGLAWGGAGLISSWHGRSPR